MDRVWRLGDDPGVESEGSAVLDREVTSPGGDWFNALADRSVNPMVLLDDARRFVDANRAACLLLRASRADIVGGTLDELAAPACRDLLRAGWDDFLAQGTSAGRYGLAPSECERLEIGYFATANFRPGLHLSVVTFPPEPEGPPPVLPEKTSRLTRREREVMTLLAVGLDGPQIAEELSISNPTVQTHVRNAMARLGARTRVQAVAMALTRGEIPL